MSETLRWWLILQLVGTILLPLCLVLFARLPDRGYTLSKPFGLLFLGFLFWLLNSLRIIPNSSGGIVFVLLVFAAIAGVFVYARGAEMRAWLAGHWRYVVAVEALLFVVFITAAWLRAQVGSISGTEQPMDLMFINAATRASHFPPQDPWLSGHTVAYYYFGYLIVAMTGRLAGVQPEVAYNLGLAMIATLALIGAAGLAYNLVQLHEAASDDTESPDSPPAPPSREGRRGPSLGGLQSMLIAQRTRRMAPDPDAEPGGATLAATIAEPPVSAHIQGVAAARIEPGASAGPWPGTWRAPVFGLAAGLMLVLMGNLVGLLQFMSAYGIGGSGFFDWVDVQALTANIQRHAWYPSAYFGFFNASRIYPLDGADGRVITEFPMFSFILGDLHPHVMALPFVLVAVGLALTLYRTEEPLDIAFWLARPLLLIAAGVVVGALAFLNTWDIATFAFVVVAAAALSNFLRVRAFTLDLVVQVVSFALPLLVLAIVLYIPFYTSFTSQADGIGAVVSNRSVTVPGTRPLHAFLYWGPLLAVVLPFVGLRLAAMRERITPARAALAFVPAAAVVVGWALVFGWEKATGSGKLNGAAGLGSQIADRGTAWLTDAFFAATLAAALLALWLEATASDDRDRRKITLFALGLVSTALLLVLGTEFFYVGDVFNSRMNTVFKLYYQAWLLLAVSAGFALYELSVRWRFAFPRADAYRFAWGGIAAVFLAAAALYPLGGTMDRVRPYDAAGNLIKPVDTLDGIDYYPPDEVKAIEFLKTQAQGQHLVLAEAVGNDYSSAARISGATGIPAVLGWGGHEDQWRGGTMKARAGRFEDVNALYQSTDVNTVEAIVKKYGIDYIYVGPLERQTYPEAGLAKFQSNPQAFPAVYQQGTVTIYRATNPTGEGTTNS